MGAVSSTVQLAQDVEAETSAGPHISSPCELTHGDLGGHASPRLLVGSGVSSSTTLKEKQDHTISKQQDCTVDPLPLRPARVVTRTADPKVAQGCCLNTSSDFSSIQRLTVGEGSHESLDLF